jgi:hypothetical protein
MFLQFDASLGVRQEEGEEQEGESCRHGGRLICAPQSGWLAFYSSFIKSSRMEWNENREKIKL